MNPVAFNLKYTPTEIQPSDAEGLASRLAPKIRMAVEEALISGYGGGNVLVERSDTGFRVTVTPGVRSAPPISESFEEEIREFEPAHDIEELSPQNDQTLLASMAESTLARVMPSFLNEILDTLKGRRASK